MLGVLDGAPVLLVDLDGPGDPGHLEVPVSFPAVVVGVSSRSGGGPARLPAVLSAGGPDVSLSARTGVPAPWVGVAAVEEAVGGLTASVAARPRAAVALAQLLRLSAGRAVGAGLVSESLTYSMLQAGPEFAEWIQRRGEPEPGPGSGPEEPVLSRRDGDRLVVELNRPAVHNAYNSATRDALCEVLGLAVADPSLTVSISGRGPSFCSGGDLREFGTSPDPVTAHLVRTVRSPARLIAALAPRVGVELHGACMGSGIELPAFAGRVVARPSTRIALPELAMGLIPGAGGTVSLPRRIGRARTAWLALTGREIDAGTAHAWGLVDEVLAS